MASSESELRQRPIQQQQQQQQNPRSPIPNPTSPKPQRALKSLALSILFPLTLTSASIWFFTTNSNKPLETSTLFLFPPFWLIHFFKLISSALMGFAAWFVWVDGGFKGDALALYVSHVVLCVTWEPLVLGTGAVAIGFVFCVINFVTVVAVYGEFRKVNRVAGQIVKPCVAWMALLTFFTYRLLKAVE